MCVFLQLLWRNFLKDKKKKREVEKHKKKKTLSRFTHCAISFVIASPLIQQFHFVRLRECGGERQIYMNAQSSSSALVLPVAMIYKKKNCTIHIKVKKKLTRIRRKTCFLT